jgi:hypothetical protein
MENNTERQINRRALLHGIGAFAGAASAHRVLMGASQFSDPTKQLKDENDGSKKESSLTIPTWYYQQFDADYLVHSAPSRLYTTLPPTIV